MAKMIIIIKNKIWFYKMKTIVFLLKKIERKEVRLEKFKQNGLGRKNIICKKQKERMNTTTETIPLTPEEKFELRAIGYFIIGGLLSIIFTMLWYYWVFGYFPFAYPALFYIFYMCVGFGFWILSSILLVITDAIISLIYYYRRRNNCYQTKNG